MICKSFGIILQAQDSRQNKAELWTTFKIADPIPLQHSGNRGKTTHHTLQTWYLKKKKEQTTFLHFGFLIHFIFNIKKIYSLFSKVKKTSE